MTANAVNNLLPAEAYTLEIVESEYVPTCDGLGMVLKCKAQVVGGPYEDRPYWMDYYLEHQSDERMEVGQRDFAGLRRATGVLAPDDSKQLHFVQFGVKIGIKARKDTGELENIIKEYLFGDAAVLPKRQRSKVKSTEWRTAA